jgi:hypothetical protein
MGKLQVPQARFAQPHMPVRQQNLGDLYAPEHIITTIEHTTTGIVITTNQGQWLFRPDELVTFPRRPDNSTADWRGRTPLPTDLAIGDALDPADGAAALLTDQDRLDAIQYVTAVTRNPARPDNIVINTRSAYSGPAKWNFLLSEPVIFPRVHRERPTGRNPYQVQLTGYGPYLYLDHTTQDEYLYFLVTHPSGGGTWPRYLQDPIKIGPGIYLARPPTSKGKHWTAYQFCGERWERHPRDPQWGQDPTTAIDPARLQAAYAAYADYRQRTAPPAPPAPS